MVPPTLTLGVALKTKPKRPSHRIDAILGDANPSACQQRNQAIVVSFGKSAVRGGAASAAVCLDVRSRHILARVLAVARVLLEESFKIVLYHPGELRTRKPFPELGCADRAFCQGVFQLLGVSSDVAIGVGRQFIDTIEVRVPVERICNSFLKNFLLALF